MKAYKLFLYIMSLAVVGLSSCEKDEREDLGEAPDRGKVAVINVASQLRTPSLSASQTLSFFLNIDGNKVYTAPLRSLNTTGYFLVEPGQRVFRADSTLGQSVLTDGVGQSIANRPAAPVLTSTLSIAAGKFYSLFLCGDVQAPQQVFIEDDLTRPAAGKAKVRVINLSPDAATGFDVAFGRSNVTPIVYSNLATNVTFKNTSAFASVDDGLYTVQLRNTGSATAVLTRSVPDQSSVIAPFPNTNGSDVSAISMRFESGKIYTLVIRGYTTPANVASKGVALSMAAVYNLYF